MTVPEKSTKNFSIRLNSEGLCFICLRDTKADGGDHAPPTSFRLRNITRFLGIDTKKILKAYLNYDLKRCSDVKVELCERCSEQVKKFNCLYQALELTKLKLNECVRKISSLIKEAEEECDQDRTGEMERRVTHAATKGVIVDLRTGISRKCLEFWESVPPRLILKRLPESELTKFLRRKRVVATGLDSQSQPIKIEVVEEDDDGESRSFIDSDTAASQMSDSDTGSVASQKRQDGPRLKPVGKRCRLDIKLPCPFCKAICAENRELQLHFVTYHLQTHFFPEEEYKEPSLSSRQFVDIVHHHLFKNIFTDHPVSEVVSRCPYCSSTYHKNHPSFFRLHIIQNHQASLIQRLKQLQKGPLPRLLKKTKAWVCKCGDYFANHLTYRFHRKRFCNLIKNLPVLDDRVTVTRSTKNTLEVDHQQTPSQLSKHSNGSMQTSCPHCRAKIKAKLERNLKAILENHLARKHLHTFFPEDKHKEPSFSSLQFKQVIHHFLFENIVRGPDRTRKELYYKCPHCNVTHTKNLVSRSKLHLIKSHYLALVQRLEELQKDARILGKLGKIRNAFACECGDYFRFRKPFEDHRKRFCNRGNDDNQTNCFRLNHSTSCAERDPLAFESECRTDGLEGMSDSEVGDVKPGVSVPLSTESVVHSIGEKNRRRRSSELDSNPNPSSPETESVPQKILKIE